MPVAVILVERGDEGSWVYQIDCWVLGAGSFSIMAVLPCNPVGDAGALFIIFIPTFVLVFLSLLLCHPERSRRISLVYCVLGFRL